MNYLKNPFLLVPLPAIRLVLTHGGADVHPSHLTYVYYSGLYTTAMKLSVNDKDAVMQFIYFAYRDQNCLTRMLQSCWRMIRNELGYDPHYKGMISGKLDYENEGADVLAILQEHPDWLEEVCRWAHVLQMLKYSAASHALVPVILEVIDQNRVPIQESLSPYVAISAELMKNICDIQSRLKVDDLAALALHMGVCSKLGSKAFVATTKVEILCRMFGCATKEQLDKVLADDPRLHGLYEHYSSRRHYESILSLASERYHLRHIGLKRRTYVSHRFSNDRDFITAIAAKDQNLQEARRKKEQKALIKEIFHC